MKWDNTTNLPPEVENRINARLQSYLDENQTSNGGEDSRNTQKLIIDLYVIYKGALSPLDKARLELEIIQKGTAWETDDPALDQIQKFVNRLMKGHYNSANDYILKAVEHNQNLKSQGAAEKIKATGQAGANKRHEETNIVIEKAKNFYQANIKMFKTKKAAARELTDRFPPVKFGTYLNKLKKW